jgi:hypothetical protein
LTCWLTGLVRSASADTARLRMETRLNFIFSAGLIDVPRLISADGGGETF